MDERQMLESSCYHAALYCLDSKCSSLAETVSAKLAEAGVQTAPGNLSRDCSGAAILLFESFSSTVGETIRSLSKDGAERVIAISSQPQTLGDEKNLLESGASYTLQWDDQFHPQATTALLLKRWREVDELFNSVLVRENLVGDCKAWRRLIRQIIEAARFTNAPILLSGETGTGKELAARLIHALDSKRSQHNLVVLDCTTIVPDLSGSELFGHDRGAFTGAVNARDGAFGKADKGCLFLDEIGELPLNLQVQLLRVLQEHTYKRVGSDTWRETDFRLISATNRNLMQEEAQGRFRRDLYYRIANWIFKLPPLRERREDIIPLAKHFMQQERPQEPIPEFNPSVEAYLMQREYPGNVRDLKNLMTRIMAVHVGPGPITLGDIPMDEWPSQPKPEATPAQLDLDAAVRSALQQGMKLSDLTGTLRDAAFRFAVEAEKGNLQRAAKLLGLSDRSIQLWQADQRKLLVQ
jgi:transcriptional regulator with GAF, ATPase, and Fis domain